MCSSEGKHIICSRINDEKVGSLVSELVTIMHNYRKSFMVGPFLIESLRKEIVRRYDSQLYNSNLTEWLSEKVEYIGDGWIFHKKVMEYLIEILNRILNFEASNDKV